MIRRWLRSEPKTDVLAIARVGWCYVLILAACLVWMRAQHPTDHTRFDFTRAHDETGFDAG